MDRPSVFLDRDGVINRKLPGRYVGTPEAFDMLPGVPEAFALLREKCQRIIVLTNQQGIGKGLMTEADLVTVHRHMLTLLGDALPDRVYHCPDLAGPHALCRKPNIGMVLKALQDFPDIQLPGSYMVGDSPSDMEMASRCGLIGVRIESHSEYTAADFHAHPPDLSFATLLDFARHLHKTA